jgi:GNAT superfamily N-acetyltransferase
MLVATVSDTLSAAAAPGLTIRAATWRDEESILDLWLQLLVYHRSIEEVWPARWAGPRDGWRDRLRALLRAVWDEPERQAVFVACVDGRLAGFVRVALRAEGPLPAQVETLFVAEEHRGRGVACALTEAGEQWCAARGATEIGVEFIAANDSARRAYERLGYSPFMVTYMRRLEAQSGATTE